MNLLLNAVAIGSAAILIVAVLKLWMKHRSRSMSRGDQERHERLRCAP